MKEIFEKSKSFVYRNARPLDLARWNYLFENGDKQEVVKYLAAYQNPDGGFANALEPDCWNLQSTPVQTWVATRIIEEIGLEDEKHPLITGILNYLETTPAFDGHCWNGLNTVPSNNDHPHAPWWAFMADANNNYNPSASLIGFILKYAEKQAPVYERAARLLREADHYFKSHAPLASMHEISCFVELYDYLKESEAQNMIDLNALQEGLRRTIREAITFDTARWNVEYCCKPSQFVRDKNSEFYLELRELCAYECEFIRRQQQEDGTWAVTWNWSEYPEEWAVSKNWWKTDIILKNLKYLQAFA